MCCPSHCWRLPPCIILDFDVALSKPLMQEHASLHLHHCAGRILTVQGMQGYGSYLMDLRVHSFIHNPCRDLRCCPDQRPEATGPDVIEKEQSVAWSVPYFVPGGSDFAPGAQPTMSVRGIFVRQHAPQLCSISSELIDQLQCLLILSLQPLLQSWLDVSRL